MNHLKFSYGQKQKVNSIELDKLFTDLQAVLQNHPLVPPSNVDAIVSEWINDLLFIAGKITEEEIQEAMRAFETQGAEGKKEAPEGEEEESDEDDNDEE